MLITILSHISLDIEDQPDDCAPLRRASRPRAAAIRSNVDSWALLFPSLHAHLISGSALSEQKHEVMVNSGQQYLQKMLSEDG